MKAVSASIAACPAEQRFACRPRMRACCLRTCKLYHSNVDMYMAACQNLSLFWVPSLHLTFRIPKNGTVILTPYLGVACLSALRQISRCQKIGKPWGQQLKEIAAHQDMLYVWNLRYGFLLKEGTPLTPI